MQNNMTDEHITPPYPGIVRPPHDTEEMSVIPDELCLDSTPSSVKAVPRSIKRETTNRLEDVVRDTSENHNETTWFKRGDNLGEDTEEETPRSRNYPVICFYLSGVLTFLLGAGYLVYRSPHQPKIEQRYIDAKYFKITKSGDKGVYTTKKDDTLNDIIESFNYNFGTQCGKISFYSFTAGSKAKVHYNVTSKLKPGVKLYIRLPERNCMRKK